MMSDGVQCPRILDEFLCERVVRTELLFRMLMDSLKFLHLLIKPLHVS